MVQVSPVPPTLTHPPNLQGTAPPNQGATDPHTSHESQVSPVPPTLTHPAVILLAISLVISPAWDRKSDSTSASPTPSSASTQPTTSAPAPAHDPAKATEARELDPPAADGSLAPNIYETPDGFGLSWLEPVGDGEGYALRFAESDGMSWSAARTIARGEEFFANWADLPSVVRTGPDRLLAHWLRKSGDATYAYDVVMARSRDGGETWNPLGSPHADGTKTEHGFVSLVPGEQSTTAIWLDGRETVDDGPMTLRTTTIDARTSVVAAEGGGPVERPATVLDRRVCDCCATDAVRVGGKLVVVYRDRSGDEVRDISVVRRVDGEWTDPTLLNRDGWTISGCPVNGPALAGDGSAVVATWFTKADERPRVRAAISEDEGRAFSDPIPIAGSDGERTPMGRVDVTLTGDDAVVSWLDGPADGAGDARVMVRRIGLDGALGRPVVVAETAAERSSGFPKIVATSGQVALVWLGSEETGKLHASILAVDDLPEAGSAPPAKRGRAATRPAAQMPEFEARGLGTDETVQLEPTGDPTLVNLWATWCAPCRDELPVLQKVADRWGSKGLRMIGLSVEERDQRGTIADFVDARSMPFDVWFAPDTPALSAFGADAVPATFVYDRDGILIWSHDGAFTDEQRAALATKLESRLPDTASSGASAGEKN